MANAHSNMERINRLETKSTIHYLWIALIIFLVQLLIYWPTKDAKFASDFMQWAYKYETIGFKGLANSFGDVSLKYTYHFLMFSAYKIFGLNGLGWHIWMSVMHSIGIVLFYRFLRIFFGATNISLQKNWLVILPVLLILFSPYNSETVVWAAAIHFLFIPILIFSSFIFALKYNNQKNNSLIIYALVLFIIGMFATEAIIVLPFATVLIMFITGFWQEAIKWKNIILFVLPQLIFICVFFIATKMILGNAIGHYGAETHLTFDLKYIGQNLLKYHLKYFGLYRYWHFEPQLIKKILDSNKAIILTYSFIIISVLVWIISLIKKWHKLSLALAFYFLFLLFLIPVINLENQSVYSLETDRYSFVPSYFFYAFIVAVLIPYLKDLGKILIFVYLFFGIYGLIENIKIWKENGIIFHRLIQSFPKEELQKIYVLNVGDSYKGSYLFRNGLKEALLLHRKETKNINLYTFGHINMQQYDDSIKITYNQNDSIQILVGDWGRWFIHYGNGVKDSTLQFRNFDGSAEFGIRFLQPNPKDIILYQKGDQWRRVSLK